MDLQPPCFAQKIIRSDFGPDLGYLPLASGMIYCIVSARVVVCEIEPEVAVTVTLAVVGPLGVVPQAVTMLRPTIPMARNRTMRTARRFLQPKRQRARAIVVPGNSGVELGRTAEDLKGTLTAGVPAKTENRPAGGEADFECAQQPLGVLSFAFCVESRVMEVDFLLEPADTVELIL